MDYTVVESLPLERSFLDRDAHDGLEEHGSADNFAFQHFSAARVLEAGRSPKGETVGACASRGYLC